MTTFPVITHGSKIGIHASQFPTGVGGIIGSAALRGVPFPVIKSVDNGGTLLEARHLSPTSLTIWRFVQSELDGIDLDVTGTDLEWIASRLTETVLTRASLIERSVTDRFEIANENHPKTKAGWVRLAELQKLMVVKLAEHGLKAVCFSLNCGTPRYKEIEWILQTGVFQVMNEHGAWLGLHEGILPASDHGVPDGADAMWGLGLQLDDAPPIANGGIFTFRYRYWLKAARDMGLDCPPIVLTEFYPWTRFPLNMLAPEDVADIYARCDAEFSKDAELLACLPFTIGDADVWTGQQHAFAYPDLIDYAVRVRGRFNAPRGQPIPPPDPDRYGIATPILRNLRATPGGGPALVGAWGGSRWRVKAQNGDYFLVESAAPLWIHKSGIKLE